jgi:nanoRNase/pAp phosphatase (c-di-AMP/oligoRNAs hydrolase)
MTASRWDLKRSEEKLKELETLLSDAGRRTVLLLCHNNPDPDALGSASGFHFLLKRRFGVRAAIGHGGIVTRAENKAMIMRLQIPMTRMTKLTHSKYYGIAVLDAQPGTGNNLYNTRKEPPLIVIDHHPVRKASYKARFHDIRPDYGATSTIVTEYLVASNLTPPRRVANALLYGIKTDTATLVRSTTRSDLQAYQFLSPLTNPRVISRIEKPSLDPSHYADYCRGLAQTVLYRDVAVSYLGAVQSGSIIPELADFLLRIDGVSWALCMGYHGKAMFLSLRTTAKKQGAGNVIRKLLGKAGSAGGHHEMAGGQMPVNGMSPDEIESLSTELADKFLQLIERPGAHAKRLVASDACGDTWGAMPSAGGNHHEKD